MMLLLRRTFFFVCFAILALHCHKNSAEPKPQECDSLRVSAYLYSYEHNWIESLPGIDLAKITDINLAFINPDEDGAFATDNNLAVAIGQLHAKNLRVFMSIGGGAAPAYLADLIKDGHREVFIDSIVQTALRLQFDGVDVDLENDLVNENYDDFVNELADALAPHRILITAALASWNADRIGDGALSRFNFINIMSYDKTGPWDPGHPGPHSPFEMAESDANYFHSIREIPANKLFIGVPFYGYGFGGNAPESILYSEIVAQYPGAESKDEVTVTGGGKIYYNGIPTIIRKVKYARDINAAGIMIWEITQDTRDEKSLLRAISEN